MRVVTTAHKAGLEQYGQRWLDARHYWPKGTEFHWYTEGYELPPQKQDGIVRKDFAELPDFSAWKGKHASYVPPNWEFNVVGYAHKVFAATDALYEYDGIGVWCDADCVAYRKIPEGLIEKYVDDALVACYLRPGLWTETGLWVMDCRNPAAQSFFDVWRAIYLEGVYKELPAWHDCMTFDATLRRFKGQIKVYNLSGRFANDQHPQAKSELGGYLDHCKGNRKQEGFSPENNHRHKKRGAQ